MPTAATPQVVTLGTRGSKLALAQAEIVRAALLKLSPVPHVNLETISTTGDQIQDRPLSQVGGNGLFVRQIELALEEGRIDMAVHSAKDLPSVLSPGMTIAAYLPRADVRDVLVSRDGAGLRDLPPGARVGTSSPRRACLLGALRPDLVLTDIRGNVDTRLRKLREGQYDAIVLAAAGLERLGLLDQISDWLDPQVMIPAVAQGALAVEVREADAGVVELASMLNDPQTWTAVTAERAFLAAVGGSCALPVAAHAIISGDRIKLVAMIGATNGRGAQMVMGDLEGAAGDPAAVGTALARDLLAKGGSALVAQSPAGA
jgi:hydroxymethylbilane synthase